MSSPSTPSPAAHHFARLCQRSGRWTGGHLVRFWAMSSPPHRHRSTSSRAASTVCHSARLILVLFPVPIFLQMVRGVQRASQGRAIPSSSPRRPSPPCRGVPRHIGGTSGDREGVVQPSQGGEGRPCDSKFLDFLRGCIALNINYLFSPKGLSVQ